MSRPRWRTTTSRAVGETAMPASTRSTAPARADPASRRARERGVAVWNVATTGARDATRAGRDALGTSGSCTCSRSTAWARHPAPAAGGGQRTEGDRRHGPVVADGERRARAREPLRLEPVRVPRQRARRQHADVVAGPAAGRRPARGPGSARRRARRGRRGRRARPAAATAAVAGVDGRRPHDASSSRGRRCAGGDVEERLQQVPVLGVALQHLRRRSPRTPGPSPPGRRRRAAWARPGR